jgi:hypothetical protein
MFPLTPSNTAQTLGLGPSARPGRRATASAVIVGAAAIAMLALAHTSANAAENSSRMAQKHHACAVVLGIGQPGDLYDTCIRSLDRSLSEWGQARQVQNARSACAQEGLQPGAPAFAVCVVNAEQSPVNARGYRAIVPVQ